MGSLPISPSVRNRGTLFSGWTCPHVPAPQARSGTAVCFRGSACPHPVKVSLVFIFTIFRFSPWHPHSAPHPTDTCYFQSQSRSTLGVFPVLVSAGSPNCQVRREVLIVKGPSYRTRRSSLPCCSAQPSPDRGDLISIYSVASSVSLISKSQSRAVGVR